MQIKNPSTGEVIRDLPEDSETSLNEKLQLLKKGQKSWAKFPLEKRLECISRFSDLLLENKNLKTLSTDLTLEMGKPISESENEIKGATNRISFFLKESKANLSPEQVNQDGNVLEIIKHEPLGVIANISAWNYPYLVGVNVIIPALICGNAVMYKPSEFSSLTGLHIQNLLHESGIPKNVFQIAIGAGEVGSHLLDMDFNGFFFTGSYPTGVKIAQKVASKLVPLGLELGGKDPMYVTDEIEDIKSVAESAAEGTFYNNGQSCCSVERVYVHEKVYDKFLKYFINYSKGLNPADPLKESTNMGAITRDAHIQFLEDQVKDAIQKGAELLLGGEKIEGVGNFFKPTVLINVDHSMKVMKEETFGPIIGIQKVQSDQEAINLMNDTSYGLTSSVFTNNKTRGQDILENLDSGTAYLNCCDRVSGYLPWSGRKNSGLGTTLSKYGLWAFTSPKGYHLRT